MKKIKVSYNDYVNDLYTIFIRSDIKYQSFQKFLEYALNTDRFDEELGYTRNDIEKEKGEKL